MRQTDKRTDRRRDGQTSTFAAEGSFDPGDVEGVVEGLLLLTVLTEGDDAVELLVVLTAAPAAELVHLVLRDGHTHTHTHTHTDTF